jgi:hypothetical protein
MNTPSDEEIDAFLDSPADFAWVIAGTRERYRMLVRAALAKWAAPRPVPAPLSESIDQLERDLAIIGVVGAIDGHDVVRRESVLEIARRAALAAQGGTDE